MTASPGSIVVSTGYKAQAELLRLTPAGVFADARIEPWRTLADRQNCTLRFEAAGRSHLWHVKRYLGSRAVRAMLAEVNGYQHLIAASIPTLDLVAHGTLDDRRAFTITADLTGYLAGDKYIASAAGGFDQILQPTARLAARLHAAAPAGASLHHRDLYLCHFFIHQHKPSDVRLIDVARVRPLPRLFRQRWIVKDLAQFLYSTYDPDLGPADITDLQRRAWLAEYAAAADTPLSNSLHHRIYQKVQRIARHDAHLREDQPMRNISIPPHNGTA